MLTRRGRLLVVVVIAAVLMAWQFGARSLNAVVVPALVALAAAWMQVRRLNRPEVERTVPRYGFVGEADTVEVQFDAPTPFAALVTEGVDDGLAIPADPVETTLADTTVTYPLELEGRGEHGVGPTTVYARDVLGLLERRFHFPGTDEVLVFPRVHELDGELVRGLRGLTRGAAAKDRHEFDRLREYERGDTLRDVHWKASAKRDDLIVKEFETARETRTVELAAIADDGRVDAMAEAAASVAAFLLDRGLAVGLTTPSGRLPPGRTDDRGGNDRGDHRTRLLTLLARTAAGGVPSERREDADVTVHAASGDEDVAVTIDGRRFAFDQLSGASATDEGAPSSSAAGRAVRTDGGRPRERGGEHEPTGGERR
jgi:uncharacterized protein (DUF58 family)